MWGNRVEIIFFQRKIRVRYQFSTFAGEDYKEKTERICNSLKSSSPIELGGETIKEWTNRGLSRCLACKLTLPFSDSIQGCSLSIFEGYYLKNKNGTFIFLNPGDKLGGNNILQE